MVFCIAFFCVVCVGLPLQIFSSILSLFTNNLINLIKQGSTNVRFDLSYDIEITLLLHFSMNMLKYISILCTVNPV